MDIKIVRYNPEYKMLWNNFVDKEKSPFFFNRDFMEYHGNKFQDHSTILFYKEKPAVIFPTHQYQDSIFSHKGLSFGGFIIDSSFGSEITFRFCRSLMHYYKNAGFSSCFYKKVPLFYNNYLAQSDDFFLFQSNAKLESRETNLVIPLQESYKLQERKRRTIQKATDARLSFTESDQWENFWEVLTENLQSRHKTRPVHSISEIRNLKELFPKNIRLFTAIQNKKILAGSVLFIHPNVIHSQYIASTIEGRNDGAVDFLFKNLIEKFSNYAWFSLGVSSLREGGKVNKGLTEWKEGFGAIPFSHDYYKINLNNLDFYQQVYQKVI